MVNRRIERGSRLVVAILETTKAISKSVEISEVGGFDDLSLDDGEHDLDLVQPRRVDR